MQQVHLHGLHLLHGQDLYHIWKSVDQEGLQGGAVHLCQEEFQYYLFVFLPEEELQNDQMSVLKESYLVWPGLDKVIKKNLK